MDETVLITGCSSGIGRETALSFLADGWEVYATARNPADIQTLGEKGCHISTLDVTEADDVERVIDEIIDEHGHLDCLVNNAGYAQPGPVEDVPIEQVHAQFDVNVYGPLRLARAALSHMRERGKGTIINVSSAVGRVAVPGMGIYSGSKFALEGISDSLRGEVDEYDVDVVLVEPGPVDTEFYDRASDEIEGVERSGGYDRFYEMYGDRQAVDGGMPGAVHPKEVADTILDAANVQHPDARYPVGTVAQLTDYARILPASWLDKLYGTVSELSTSDWVKKFFD
ncbi:oxidoreductase [Haladaptatus paucihalophilus DX253]|uniref:Oxidoreductase n=1 Tax=Haladaptatus paucihalophilus DX253 TaxID=797209 RepID=E7QRK2_HALPU|nr:MULTISPECIES: SDR family oxidoreductase [Haladaptatus]EFW92621.1 oxidoreductase [Haladaptatus paucihalophilus DX253]GKZ13778.1 short-chain dehydrogenase/reductase [Haladaptatus sp. T7]SHK17435.1 Short-chain dehydrogenase [Haladaptatus paucihalophilus DX253]